jgi:hypothetical protein
MAFTLQCVNECEVCSRNLKKKRPGNVRLEAIGLSRAEPDHYAGLIRP